LWKWFTAATGNTNRSLRANGSILVKDSFGKPRVRYKLYGCLPIKIKAPTLNAKDSGIAIEEMEISVNSFEIESAEVQGAR
jgi:phage tail-like protein